MESPPVWIQFIYQFFWIGVLGVIAFVLYQLSEEQARRQGKRPPRGMPRGAPPGAQQSLKRPTFEDGFHTPVSRPQATGLLLENAPGRFRPSSAGGFGTPSWLANAATPVPTKKLSHVAMADNVAIIGPKGSGKTTVLRSLLSVRNGEMVAIDPHNSPGKWPCYVVGSGRDYDAIRLGLERLHMAMTQRFQQLGSGERRENEFGRRTLVGDEFRSIAENLPDDKRSKQQGAGTMILARISEGRKVDEDTVIACHNDTVGALGIEGNGDMKTCFDYFIYLGGLVALRCKDEVVLKAALEMDWPGVVFDTTTGRYALLVFDAPVLDEKYRFPIHQDVPVAAAPIRQRELAPADMLDDEPDLLDFAPEGFGPNDMPLSQVKPDEIMHLVAGIAAGRNKSELIKATPGYGGRKYKALNYWHTKLLEQQDQAVNV